MAVLHPAVPDGAPPDEQDALVEAASVADALAELGHEPVRVALSLDLAAAARSLRELAPDLVFNLVESVDGCGRLIHLAPALLDHLGLPYTGAPTDAVYLTSNKLLAKQQLAAAGLPTPAWRAAASEALAAPFITKSVWEHASIGLDERSIDRTGSSPPPPGTFQEAYVEGREFNLSLVGPAHAPELLPPAEIRFVDYPAGKPRMVCYKAKWEQDSFEYHHTPRSFAFGAGDASLLGRLAELARAAWDAFALRGYARVDFRVDGAGNPWILEVNNNPCLSPDSGFVAAAAEAGLGYARLVGRIVEAAV